MAKTEDIKENKMETVDRVDYIRGILGEDSVNVEYSTLKKAMAEFRPNSVVNANDLEIGDWTYIEGGISNFPYNIGYIMTMGSGDQKVQFAFDGHFDSISVRLLIYGVWTSWKSNSLT